MINEICFKSNPDHENVSVYLNSWLASEQIRFRAWSNGELIYDEELTVPEEANWWQLVVVGAAVAFAINGDGHVRYNNKGGKNNFSAEITYNQKSGSGGDSGVNCTLFNGDEFVADSFSIKSTHPYEDVPEDHIPKLSNILLTGRELETIRFEDETFENE